MGALLMKHPSHKQGHIEILLSPAGHIMHLCNTVFILCEMKLSQQTMQQADIALGVYYGLSYCLFEWLFHHYTGAWHYPFLDYNARFAWIAYLVLFGIFSGYWLLGCRITAAHASKQHRV